MSFLTAKDIQLSDKVEGRIFNWWIVDNIASNLIPYANSPYGRNFRCDWQWVDIRPWYTILWAKLGWTWATPFWISWYQRSDATLNRLIVGYKQDATHYLVSVATDWTQTPITTAWSITVENRMSFVNWWDNLYLMNGTDTYSKINWTTFTANVWTALWSNPRFGTFYNYSMWLAWSWTKSNEIYKSKTDNYEDFTVWWWSSADLITLTEPVTWIESNNQNLYIFTRNQIHVINDQTIRDVGWTLVYSSKALTTSEWAVNNECIVSYWNHTYFLSRSNKLKIISPQPWLWAFDVQELSHRLYRGIDNTMKTLDPDQSNAFAYVDTKNSLIKWHTKTLGSSFNNLVIVYNILWDWFLIDNNKFFNNGCFFDWNSYTISALEDKIYQDEYWNTDDDMPIQFEYHSKDIDLWYPTQLKELWAYRLFLWMNDLATVTVQTYANWWLVDTLTLTSADVPLSIWWIGTQMIWTQSIWTEWFAWAPWLSNVIKVRQKGYLQVRATKFRFVFRCSSLWARILLQDLLPKMEMCTEKSSPTWNY